MAKPYKSYLPIIKSIYLWAILKHLKLKKMKNLNQLETIFSASQLEAIKEIINSGFWGDSDIEFTNGVTNYAFGFSTNETGKGKQFSGVCSGIAKTIKKSGTNLIKYCSNWWGDNNGDMIFINSDLLDVSDKDLYQWAKK